MEPVFKFDIPLYPVKSPTIYQVKAEQKGNDLVSDIAYRTGHFQTKKDPEEKKPSSMSSAADIASELRFRKALPRI